MNLTKIILCPKMCTRMYFKPIKSTKYVWILKTKTYVWREQPWIVKDCQGSTTKDCQGNRKQDVLYKVYLGHHNQERIHHNQSVLIEYEPAIAKVICISKNIVILLLLRISTPFHFAENVLSSDKLIEEQLVCGILKR